MKRWISSGLGAGFFAGALLVSSGASVALAEAPQTSFRIEQSAQTFTPLQSHAHGKTETAQLFFGGLSGMGLHPFFVAEIAFPVDAYNREIYVYDDETGELFTSGIAHLPEDIRRALTVSNVPHIQDGDSLFLYGGYGATLDGTNWTTRETLTEIDLPMIETALRAGNPAPAGAFTVSPSPAAKTSGAVIIKMGGKFALLGGAVHTGDYGGIATQTFSQEYTSEARIFDKSVSMTSPIQALGSPTADEMRRRDMNASPAQLPDGNGGVEDAFIINGGVFNGVFPWFNPVRFSESDPEVTQDFGFEQWMNQYEAARASFWSPANGENRFVFFGGISSHVWDGENWTFDFNAPWSSEITQQRMIDGQWLGEERVNGFTGQTVTVIDEVIGDMPAPISNSDLVLNRLVPTNENGQILLDEMPANEVLLGRIYGGLWAAMPGNNVPTYASSTILDVYVATGVRGDITRDGAVNSNDLADLLGNWGTSDTRSDLNLNGAVNAEDLAILLGYWGNDTPG